eukprot:COSAG06_NODE_67854_length_251_cov_0.342105_1_plen_63_part_10
MWERVQRDQAQRAAAEQAWASAPKSQAQQLTPQQREEHEDGLHAVNPEADAADGEAAGGADGA